MSRSKKNKKSLNSNTDLLISVANFDTREPTVRPVYTGVPLGEARSLTPEDYVPMGGTPLNDAVLKFGASLHEDFKRQPDKLHVGLLNDESSSMAYAGLTASVVEGVNTFLDELKRDDSKGGEPGVIMVIMTDGEENSSREDPTGEQVRAFTQAREEEGWNFFYLGANQDSWHQGTAGLGLGANSTSFDYAATSEGTGTAYAAMASSVNLRKTTPGGQVHSNLAAQQIAGTKVTSPDIPVAPLWTPKGTTEDEEDVGS